MELEELKSIWQSENFRPKGADEIAAMLRGKSKSLITKLKRSAWFEFIFTVFAAVALIAYAIKLPNGSLKWSSIAALVLCIAFSFYYVKKILLLNSYDSTPENVRGHLQKLINNLEGYLRFYQRSYAILYPVYFFMGIGFALLENGPERLLLKIKFQNVVLFLLLHAAIFFVLYKFTKWYLNQLYGKHLAKLKTLLNDLTSEIIP